MNLIKQEVSGMRITKNYLGPLLLTLGVISFIYMAMIITGTAPISPKSHQIISNLVNEVPRLDTPYYQELNKQLFISNNDLERLYADWEMVLKQ